MLIKKLRFFAELPVYATEGAACFDLYACIERPVSIPPGRQESIPTGLAFAVPDGHYMALFSRSGQASKHGVRLANCTGIIDADYRGEIVVMLRNDGDVPIAINHGDRIAQGLIQPVARCEFEEVAELPSTSRGTGGFGSTGI